MRLADKQREFSLARLRDYTSLRGLQGRDRLDFLTLRVREMRDFIRQVHEDGAGGLELVHLYSGLIDSLICALYEEAEESYYSRYPRLEFPLAIVAVGGYGRRHLCPSSDIDLLFLYHHKLTPFVEAVTEWILYSLWDLGFEVGHAVRNLKELLNIAGEDSSVRTALMDFRFICGREEFFSSVRGDIEKYLLYTEGDSFIEERIAAMRKRHEKYGGVVFVLEPNLKEGKGGLRDLHTANWVMRVKFKASSEKELSLKGILSKRAEKNYYYLLDRILRMRNHLHLLSGKKTDVLSFEYQEKLAHFWGYRSHGNIRATESFMRFFYILSTQVAQLSGEMIEEVEKYLPERRILPAIFRKRQIIEGSLTLYRGKIYLNSSSFLRKDPSLYLKIFRFVQKSGYPLSEQAKRRLKKNLDLVDASFREKRENSVKFREIIREGKNLRLVLTEMNDTRFFGKFIPEFAHLFYRAQQDLYHRFTVDVHSILAASVLPELEERAERGEKLTEEENRFLEIYRQVSNRDLLLLTILFHDIGKGLGHGHSERGEKLIRQVMERLGFSPGEVEESAFLVRHHLQMSSVAQKRDMHDIETVFSFARLIGTKERLDMLYLLTYADLKAVNEDGWNRWRALLITELYEKALHIITQGEYSVPTVKERVQERKSLFREKLGGVPGAFVDRYLEQVPDRYLLSTDPEKAPDHFTLFTSFSGEPVVTFNDRAEGGYTEVTILTPDTHGLFALITGVFASHNVNILSASIYTTAEGLAFDIFNVQYLGGPLGEGEKRDRLLADLKGVLKGEKKVESLLRTRRRGVSDRKGIQYRPTRIIVDNESSSLYTIVEVITYDREGLLHDITRTLSDEGLDIYLSKISTKADQVVDVFYLTDRKGRKVTSPSRIERVRRKLLSAVEGEEGSE
ncbi:MAG: [protein-PII] uridylyltransferase [Deltaproteobacteria bacterium]|nr:MAG: [protein-PII] uridylyltransferase [Deltaproteobacteria bacterium]